MELFEPKKKQKQDKTKEKNQYNLSINTKHIFFTWGPF